MKFFKAFRCEMGRNRLFKSCSRNRSVKQRRGKRFAFRFFLFVLGKAPVGFSYRYIIKNMQSRKTAYCCFWSRQGKPLAAVRRCFDRQGFSRLAVCGRLLMLLYEMYRIRYFRSGKTIKDLPVRNPRCRRSVAGRGGCLSKRLWDESFFYRLFFSGLGISAPICSIKGKLYERRKKRLFVSIGFIRANLRVTIAIRRFGFVQGSPDFIFAA